MLYNIIILELSTFFHCDYVTVCDCCDNNITLNPNPK